MKYHTQFSYRLMVTLMAVSAFGTALGQTDLTNQVGQPIDALVSVNWLSEHLDDPDLVVLDCTVMIEENEDGGFHPVSGRANYDAGHIPSAGFADLTVDLSDADEPMSFRLPTLQKFSQTMGKLGVGKKSRVVLYSASYPDWAARVWWMLRWAGFDNVALLDGGLQAWTDSGQPLSTEPATRPEQQFVVSPRPELIADRDQVFAALNDSNVRIIDTLTREHFHGDFTMYARPGHIVGAENIPSSDQLEESGHYLPIDELAIMHDGQGDDRDSPVITYCGGGVAASSVAFNMHRLGFTNVAVYVGSLGEWATDPANPMTTEIE